MSQLRHTDTSEVQHRKKFVVSERCGRRECYHYIWHVFDHRETAAREESDYERGATGHAIEIRRRKSSRQSCGLVATKGQRQWGVPMDEALCEDGTLSINTNEVLRVTWAC